MGKDRINRDNAKLIVKTVLSWSSLPYREFYRTQVVVVHKLRKDAAGIFVLQFPI